MSKPFYRLSVKNTRCGFSVAEIVIAAAVLALITTGVATAWQFYLRLTGNAARLTTASLIAEEAGEAIQLLRDQSYSANIAPITIGSTYYLSFDGAAYSLGTTATTTQGFFRTLVFSSVYRDGSANIATSGTLDPGTRDVLITVYPTTTPSTAIFQSETLVHNQFTN